MEQDLTYRDLFRMPEYEHSVYSFDRADIEILLNLFDIYEKQAQACTEDDLIYPAYDYILKCSHTFNVLDARGAISVSERNNYIARVRGLARTVALQYIEKREELGYPLMRKEKEGHV